MFIRSVDRTLCMDIAFSAFDPWKEAAPPVWLAGGVSVMRGGTEGPAGYNVDAVNNGPLTWAHSHPLSPCPQQPALASHGIGFMFHITLQGSRVDGMDRFARASSSRYVTEWLNESLTTHKPSLRSIFPSQADVCIIDGHSGALEKKGQLLIPVMNISHE